MKTNKNIFLTFLLSLLFCSISFSQESCKTDEYLEGLYKLNPKLEAQVEKSLAEFRKQRDLLPKGNTRVPVLTIPVVFNVLHAGEQEGQGRNLPVTKISEQISVLNERFSNANNQGVDIEIRFCLATKDVFGNLNSGIKRYNVIQLFFEPFDANGNITTDDTSMKLNRDPGFPAEHYLNIWTADIRDPDPERIILGYATFPFFLPGGSTIDGVVLNYEWVGSNSSNGSTGMTAVHEVGHWLGLYHTFQGETCDEFDCHTEGDEVCDTEPRAEPADADPNNDYCDMAPKCSDPNQNTNAVKNYMDYNEDSCYSFFTQGQKDRMRDMIIMYRSNFLNNTVQITECSTTDPNGGGDPDERCTPNSEGDQLGYRIRETGGSFGADISIQNGLMAVSDYARDYVKLFRLDDCEALQLALISKLQLEDYLGEDLDTYGDKVIVHNEKVFITGKKNGQGYLVIYEENSDSDWVVDQFLDGYNYAFGEQMLLHEDELLVTSKKELYSFREVNGNYVLNQTINILVNETYSFIPFKGHASYNGTYFVANTYGHYPLNASFQKTFIFKRNGSGNWTASPIHSITDTRYARVEIDKQNRFFLTRPDAEGVSRVEKYVINSRNDNVNFIQNKSLQSFGTNTTNNYYWQQPIRIIRNNNLLISVSNGAGVTFYDMDLVYNSNNNDMKNVIVPELSGGFSSNFLNPYYDANHADYFNRVNNYGTSASATDDNYLVVGNSSCQEVYVYKTNNLLKNAYPQGGSTTVGNLHVSRINQHNQGIITGNNITMGESISPRAAAPEFADGDRTYLAKNSITIREGTKVLRGTRFRARASASTHLYGDVDCPFTGGEYRIMDNPNPDGKKFVYSTTEREHQTELPTVDYVVEISPNPSFGLVNFESNSDIDHIEITNVVGNVHAYVKMNGADRKRAKLNVDTYPSGVYFVKILLTNGHIITKTLIRE